MKSHKLRTALLVLTLAAASCGSSDDPAATDASAEESVTTTSESPATTVEESTTTAAPTTEATTTTVEETTTTAAPVVPDPPPPGTGVLTVDGVEFPFTIETCVKEPRLSEVTDSIFIFEVRGATVAEGQPAEARLFRSESPTRGESDSFGWGYTTDRNDFEALRSEGTGLGLEDHIIVQQTEAGTVFYGPPTPFERTEGISVVDDVDPGMGSIIATC